MGRLSIVTIRDNEHTGSLFFTQLLAGQNISSEFEQSFNRALPGCIENAADYWRAGCADFNANVQMFKIRSICGDIK